MDENYVNALVQDHYWESQNQCFCHKVLEPYEVEIISFTFPALQKYLNEVRLKFCQKFSTAKAHRFIPKEELKEVRDKFNKILKIFSDITYRFLQVKNFSVQCEFQYDDPWSLANHRNAILFDSIDSFRYFLYLDQTAKNLEKINCAISHYIVTKRSINPDFQETEYGKYLTYLDYQLIFLVGNVGDLYTHLHVGTYNPND